MSVSLMAASAQPAKTYTIAAAGDIGRSGQNFGGINVSASDVLADARVVRLGRTMSFGRVTLLSATDNKPVAMVSSAFAML